MKLLFSLTIGLLLIASDGLTPFATNRPRLSSTKKSRISNVDIIIPQTVDDAAVTVPTPPAQRRRLITGIFAAFCISFKAAALPALAIDVSGIRVEGSSVTRENKKGKEGNIDLAGITYTPAAMILQMAEQTASMEGMMKVSASDSKTKTKVQRIVAGSKGEGPGVVVRTDLVRSVDVMVTNSKVASFSPAAAVSLRGISRIVNGGTGDMNQDEYLAVARQYEAAREDLRRAFESLSSEKQAEGKIIMRGLRAKDEERMQTQIKKQS